MINMAPETFQRKYKPRRSRDQIEADNYAKRLRRFWRENHLAIYDRQWRYLRNCGHWVDPLTFKFETVSVRNIAVSDMQICGALQVCAWCDARHAAIYSWDGYICIGCNNRYKAKQRLLRECKEIDVLIKNLRAMINEKNPKNQRRSKTVSLRDHAKSSRWNYRYPSSNDGVEVGGADQRKPESGSGGVSTG